MSENQRAQDSQADSQGEGQAPEPENNDTPQSQADASEVEVEEERIPKSELNKKNKEAQNLRKERNELQRRLEAIDNEKLTEQQKLEKQIEAKDSAISEKDSRIADLETRLRRATFIETIGLPNPRLAWAALNDVSVEVEYAEDGSLTNKRQIVKALKDEFPREFGNGSANGGERAEPSVAQDMNAALRSMRGGSRG